MLAAATAAVLGVLLLAGAGPLARTAPASGSASGVEPLPPPTRSSSTSVADLVVSVSVAPNRPGVNEFTVQAASSRRPPPAPVDGVLLDLAGGGRVTLARTGPGVYSGTGRLAVAGAVRISAVISRAGRRITAPLPWSVDPPLPAPTAPSAPEASQPAVDADPGLRSVLDILAAPLLGGLILLGWRWLRRRRPATPPAPQHGPAAETPERVLEGVR